MATRKRQSTDPGDQPPKIAPKRRGFVSLKDKMEVVTRIERGEEISDVCTALNLSPSNVASILKDKDRIKRSFFASCQVAPTRIQSDLSETVEKVPAPHTDDLNQHHGPTTSRKVKTPKKMSNLGTNKSIVEDNSNPIIVDTEAASKFPSHFKHIVDEGDYPPDLVFNVVETGLYWKKMPPRTYISRDEYFTPGFKSSKDCMRLIVGGNASGTFRLKPLLVYHIETPQVMMGIPKTLLPVIWKSNKKVTVTQSIFGEWYSYFCSAVAQFCNDRKLPPKVLLVLDNVTGHLTNLSDIRSAVNVKVLYLPVNTSSVLQPMDQGVVATFKAFYHQKVMKELVQEIASSNVTVSGYWNSYNILNAVDHICTAWYEIPASLMNCAWRKLWPNFSIPDFSGLELVEAVSQEICKLAQEAGLDNVNPEEVRQLLASHDQPLSGADLEQLSQQQKKEEHQEENSEIRSMSTSRIQEALTIIKEQCQVFANIDPDWVRSSTVRRSVTVALQPYYQILRERKMNSSTK